MEKTVTMVNPKAKPGESARAIMNVYVTDKREGRVKNPKLQELQDAGWVREGSMPEKPSEKKK